MSAGPRAPGGGDSTVTVALLFPDLLGTYGDSGNATVLAQRLRWRGHPARVVTVAAGDPVPASCELYVLGGGEDLPQALAARQLAAGRPLHRAVDAGAAVLAVCAGLQIVGTSFVGPDGVEVAGLGLVDCRTAPGPRRAVGEVVVAPPDHTGLPALSGYENHAGYTTVAPGSAAGTVVAGVGNGDGTEGARRPRVWGTYLHGPVLARNPALADLLLSWVVGPVEPLDDAAADELRRERLAVAARRLPPPGRLRRLLAARGRRR